MKKQLHLTKSKEICKNCSTDLKALMLQLNKELVTSIVLYIIWIAATYLLEGRIHTLLRPEATFDRLMYAVIANLLIGTVVALFVLKNSLKSKLFTLKQLGFRSFQRTLIAVIIVFMVSFSIFLLGNPPSLNPMVLMNVYSQVLVVSVAEVVVCWAVIGTCFESLAKTKGKIISLIVAILVSTCLFGIYHFAHSPPFNQMNMVLFLMIPGFGTSLIYFLVRDIYAAIIFQNFMGVTGVMQSINLIKYSQPLYPLIVMAIVTILFLVVFHVLSYRKDNITKN
jgi:hypothetical protein